MKIVEEPTCCDICGESFMGEFILHETPEDDWEGESEHYKDEETTYPHSHHQPTVECHICPECRNH